MTIKEESANAPALRYLVWCNLYNRTLIHFLRIQQIISDREENNSGRDQARPVHMRRIRAHRRREETENDDDSPITNRPCVKCYAQHTRDMERAPDKFIGLPGIASHLARFSDIAADAAPEEKHLSDGVGAVKRGDAYG